MPEPRPSPKNETPLSRKIQATLEGDYADIRKQARELLTQPEFLPLPAGLSKEEFRKKTRERVAKFTASGLPRLPFDPKYGGGGDPKKFMQVIAMLGHADMSFFVKQGVNFGLFGMSMYALGTDKHHAKYLPPLLDGTLQGGFAMTEVGGGSDVQGVKTEAVYDHATRSFTINTPSAEGRKAFIGNAANDGEVMVVFAQLKMSKDGETQGVHAFMVPIRDKTGKVLPGVAIEDCGDKVGLNGVDNGYISFKNVRIPQADMLDRFATIDENGQYQSDTPKKTARFFKMISTLVTGRVAVAINSMSGAKSALTAAITHAANRDVFGKTLLDLPSAQTRLFPHLANAYAMHFATRLLTDKLVANDPDTETMAAAIKARASDDAMRAIDEGRLIAGGSGYMSEAVYGRLRNDVDVFRTFEGDNTVLRLLTARNRLTDNLKNNFNLSSAPGKKPEGDVLDPAYQEKLFAQRESEMLYGVTKKIADGAQAAGGLAQSADNCQDDMIAYADAYADRVMIEQFTKAVREEKDPQARAALKDLCDLFAVNTMQKNAVWLLENNFINLHQSAQLRETAQQLNRKIRPNALALVDAFAIPPQLISVPKAYVPANTAPKKAANGNTPRP
jgi:acyl-CoA oxidase